MFKSAVLALTVFILQTQPEGHSVLKGRVVKAGSTDAVGRARIVVAKIGGQLSDYRTAIADDSGRFAFQDLTAGSYRVYANHDGYLETEFGRRPANTSGIPIVVGEKSTPADIVLSLTATSVITGRVSESGKPVRNVWVRALKATYRDGQKSLNTIGYAQTNDLGEYRIFGLAPGLYFVSAIPAQKPLIEDDSYVVAQIPSNANNNAPSRRTPGSAVLAAGTLDATAFDDDVFLPVYHPGTTSADAATPIDLKAGATISGIDLSLARSPQFHVRGRVIDGTTGQSAQNIRVELVGGPFSIPSTPNNVFDIGGVPPGDYTLIAQNECLIGCMVVVTPVTIGEKDVENLTITLVPGTSLKGKLRIEGRASNDPEISQYQVVLTRTSEPQSYSSARVEADGTFTIANRSSGDYRFHVIGAGSRFSEVLYVTSAQFGADDVMNSPIKIRKENSNRTLEITGSMNTATLDVQVLDDNQHPVPGALLAAVPDPARRNRSDFYRTATSDANGRAHFDKLIPGEYKVFASFDVPATDWQDPEIVRVHESRGTAIRATGGTKQEISVKVLQ
jgi:protocatechuate 3,4-dioxygenase beta subunit